MYQVEFGIVHIGCLVNELSRELPPTCDGFKHMPRLQAIRWRPVD